MLVRRRSKAVRFAIAVLASATLAASGLLVISPSPAAAAYTTCYVYTWVPWHSGNWIYGGGTINCDYPDPPSDQIDSYLYESYGPFNWERDHDWVYATTYDALSVRTEYDCSGHGTDDWWTKSRGRDNNGNYSYWYASLKYSFNCP